uniref:SUN domain-containing protein n=1 Tax=Glossina austeni TaxID=7395 RepID=A0A1A9V1H0_GLOAU
MNGNRQTCKEIDDLRGNFEEMAHAMLSKPDVQNDRRMLMNTLDHIIKQVFSSIRDELYSLKRTVRGAECPNNALGETSVKIHERVNYASEDLGAKVVSVMAQPLYSPNYFELLVGMKYSSNPPVRMLQSNMAPGNCFAFKDDRAVVVIKLPQPVIIDQIGLSHISRKQSPTGDVSSAPKDFTVFAVTKNLDVLLGSFRYDCIQHKLLQTFFVQSSEKYDLLRFHFNSNHGHSDYTCEYAQVLSRCLHLQTM